LQFDGGGNIGFGRTCQAVIISPARSSKDIGSPVAEAGIFPFGWTRRPRLTAICSVPLLETPKFAGGIVFSRRRARGKAAHAWRLGRRFRQSCPPIAFGLPFRRVASAFSLHPFVMVCNPQAKYQVTLPQRIRQNDQLTLGKDYIFFLRAGPLIRKKPAR
jgi:hypothetical protein